MTTVAGSPSGQADEHRDLGSGDWSSMSRLYARLTRRLAAGLDESDCIPLATFELLMLIERSGGGVRMTDLLPDVTMSQAGLSRKLDRLVAQGLLTRTLHPNDRRTALIELTAAGRDALDQAAPVHRAEMVRYFTRTIAPDQLLALRVMLDRAVDGKH